MMQESQTSVPEAIMERRTHVHFPSGGVILEHVLESGIWPQGLERFQATITVLFELSNGQKFPKQRATGITAANVEEAFEMLPGIRETIGNELLEEIREELGPKVQTAGPEYINSLLNGRFKDRPPGRSR